MHRPKTDIDCDLMIIGAGMAGMAAALFAARRNINTVQAGTVGQLGFASGLIDLLGVHPLPEGRVLENPWAGISRLCRDEPDHPYARMTLPSIQTALQTVLAFLGNSGYPYAAHANANTTMITAAGTCKPTYAVPHTMAPGAAALAEKKPSLIVDFNGLRGFSSRQIAVSLATCWPGLRPVTIDFPGASGELYTEPMARALEAPENRSKLVDCIAPHLGGAEAVGFPAVLGVFRTLDVMEDLAQGLGLPVFEIPTMPPAATGLRLREIFEQELPAMGISRFSHQTVRLAGRTPDGHWLFEVEGDAQTRRISARAALLCTGRFFGRGLHAERHGIQETLFGLPVAQPAGRASWHHKDFLHLEGHAINRAGLSVDERFRPVGPDGNSNDNNLFAAGSILAHQDWMRQKCGSGLAIASAYGAVEACSELLG